MFPGNGAPRLASPAPLPITPRNSLSLPAIVIDTNVFIAAAFNPASDSARIVEATGSGGASLIWDEPTRRETEALMRRIPRVSWEAIRHLFREENRWPIEVDPGRFRSIPDPDDRKFAALASSSGATLVTLDRHLLEAELGEMCRVVRPGELAGALRRPGAGNGPA